MQSFNDFIVFGVMIVGSFSSGALLNLFGWNAVLWGSLVPVIAAFLASVTGRKKTCAITPTGRLRLTGG
ncbi:hypothetical protein OS31_01600 [Dickeya oryzae]